MKPIQMFVIPSAYQCTMITSTILDKFLHHTCQIFNAGFGLPCGAECGVEITDLCDVTPYILAYIYQYFGVTIPIKLQRVAPRRIP